MLRQVTLHGPLADRFGSGPISLNVDDVHSLMSGLNCAYPGFRRELVKHPRMAVALKDDQGVSFVSEETLGWSFGNKNEIHLATGEEGSGTGAEYIAAQFAAQFTGTAATVAYAAAYVVTAVVLAYSMYSIAQSLADQPEPGKDGKEELSGLFDQAVNLEGQGHPIPLVYGLFKVGSVVISSDVVSEKNAIGVDDSYSALTGETITGNLLDNDLDGQTLTISEFTFIGTSAFGVLTPVGSAHAPGTTVSSGSPSYSFTVNADGSFSITSAVALTFHIGYKAVSSTTANASAVALFKFSAPRNDYRPGGH